MSANIVSVDEESLHKDIENLVRKTVEETLNALLDEEASELIRTERHERTAGREAYRSGHYARKLAIGAREIETSSRGCSERSRRRSPGPATSAARRISTATLLGRVPVTRRKAMARMLKAIHAQESREACDRKAEEVADELESMLRGTAARTVRDGFAETLAYTEFSPERWRRIRTNDGIERINREIRRRTRPSGPTRTATRPSCWYQRG